MKTSQIIVAAAFFAVNPASQAESDITTPTTDFSRAEKYELYPGGAATHRKKLNSSAFSHASANMNFKRELNFKVGNGFFKRLWVSAPSSTQAADGLGPLYSARSCQRCHLKDGRGHPPNGPDDNAVSMLLRLSIPPQNNADRQMLADHKLNVVVEPTYGNQLQDFAIPGHQAEGRMYISYEEISLPLADGETVKLRKPSYLIKDLGYGPLHPKTMVSPRISPQMIGLGLLEAIDAKDILIQADPEDKDANGISGKPNQVWSAEQNKVMLGRFGWKAGMPSINEQSQAAFAGDIGISVPLHPHGTGECTTRQKTCLSAPDGNSEQFENLEAHSKVVKLVNFYSRNLAVPARRDMKTAEVLAGKKLFYQIGCIQCHKPKYVTRKDSIGAEQSHQLIWPYSDLLLHDMGEGLADHRPEGEANGREWRTAPLWGIGLTPLVNGHSFYLHDGRARNLLEAILWHGGEAEPHRNAVIKLKKIKRENLLRFVESL